MATFKYISQMKESDVTLNDVLTTGDTSKGTSYYNSSSETQYVYVENAPLAKFLAKDVFHGAVNDTNPYVTINTDSNFELQMSDVDVLKFVDDVEGNIGGGTTPAHIECDLNNVTKDTFKKALVSEVSKSGIGKHFLIAIPSTRPSADEKWVRSNFEGLFTRKKGATFTPASNTDGPSRPNDGDVRVTFNGKITLAIVGDSDARIEGNTILSDGTNLTVVCTDELYNEISKNGITSIVLTIDDKRKLTPVTMASGEGFVGE